MKRIVVAKLVVVLMLVTATLSSGATRYWVGTGNWNVAANWSASSGGIGGIGVPVPGDDVIFDAGGVGPCTVNVAVSVGTITMSGYTGTITQAGALTLTGSFVIASGSFAGGTQPISIGSFSQTGGVFTTTSGLTKITGNVAFTSGTFAHHGGTIDFHIGASGPAIAITGTPTLNDIIFSSASASFFHTINNTLELVANNITIDLTGAHGQLNIVTGSLRAKGDLKWTGNVANHQILGGTLFVEKDLLLNSLKANNNTHPTNAGTIEICGATDQNLLSTVGQKLNILPNIVINKTGGTLHLIGNITVSGPRWTVTAGTIDPGTSTIYFYQFDNLAPITIKGTHTLGNVSIELYYTIYGLNIQNDLTVANLTLNANTAVKIDMLSKVLGVTVPGTVTVNGTLRLTGPGQIILHGGIVYAHGDIDIPATNPTPAVPDATNSSVIEISGTGNQLLTGPAADGISALPNIVINKNSGKLTLDNHITVQGNWTYLQGDVDASLNASTVFFTQQHNTVFPVIDGEGLLATMSFHHVRIKNDYVPSSTINLGGTFNVNGDLLIDSKTNLNNSSNFPIYIGGNLTTTGTGTINSTNAFVRFDGFADQYITLGAALTIKNMEIYNEGVSVFLLSPLNISGQLMMTNGNIVITGGTLTLKNNASSNVGTATSYVDGPMYYEIATTSSRTLNFPIGSGGAWRPAELTVQHNVATVFTYRVELKNASASGLGYSLPASLERVSGKRYYDVTSNAGSNVTFGVIKFYFGADDEVNNLARLGVAVGKSTGPSFPTAWTDVSALPVTGTGTGSPYMTGSIVSVNFMPMPASPSRTLFALANMVAGGGVENALPIELTGLAVSEKLNKAVLTWETKTENGNDYFEVQRSSNGLEFEALTMVRGQGNKTQSSYYTWTDATPLQGVSYYRLKQADYNGRFEFSKVVRFKSNDNDNALVIYPLPVTNSNISFNHIASVRIVNNMGLTMSVHQNVDHVDVSLLSAGLYYIIDQAGVSHKMIIGH